MPDESQLDSEVDQPDKRTAKGHSTDLQNLVRCLLEEREEEQPTRDTQQAEGEHARVVQRGLVPISGSVEEDPLPLARHFTATQTAS